jgi:class 3 adenylate cyclase
LLVAIGVIGVWLLVTSLEPVVYDWLLLHTTPKQAKPINPFRIVLMDTDSVVEAQSTMHATVPWSPATLYRLLSPVTQAHPGLVVLMDALAITPSVSEVAEIPTPFIWSVSPAQWQVYQQSPDVPLTRIGVHSGSLVAAHQADGVLRALKPIGNHAMGGHETALPHPSGPDLVIKGLMLYLNQLPGYENRWHLGLSPQDGWGHPSLIIHTTSSPAQPAQHATPLANPQAASPQASTLHPPPERLTLPLDETGRYLVRWYGDQAHATTEGSVVTHPTLTLRQFMGLSPLQQRQWAGGRVILVTATANGARPESATSVSAHHLQADVVATAMNNVINGQAIVRAPGWLRSSILLLAFFVACFLRIRLNSFGRSVLYIAAVMVGYFWVALIALVRGHMMLDIMTPEVFLVLGLLAGSVWWSTNRDKQLQSLETTLSQLVDPSVLQQIRRHKKGLVPGGQRLEITSLYVDIRNFTALAENLPATEITDLLNAFYTEVERVVFQHGGTIDKYMGDGVLIMFGAPLEDARHGEAGVAAGIALRQALHRLGDRWQAERHITFKVGISMHSGFAYVGFVGPLNKLEYTALGDTINLAVRLQECNKQLGVDLVISEYTLQYCNGLRATTAAETTPTLVPLGDHRVRGRENPVGLFTLPEALSASPQRPSVIV